MEEVDKIGFEMLEVEIFGERGELILGIGGGDEMIEELLLLLLSFDPMKPLNRDEFLPVVFGFEGELRFESSNSKPYSSKKEGFEEEGVEGLAAIGEEDVSTFGLVPIDPSTLLPITLPPTEPIEATEVLLLLE